jgi:lysosomal-associated membrane protein 1/2
VVCVFVAARCSQDIKGSKIVPIAVGAALAGLVIIVLIAYIIGRLRSRRQSSYEALS